MNRYRISKYDPNNRDLNGSYTIDEWTDYSDIGKPFSGKVLLKSEYLRTENNYLSFCEELWIICGEKPLKVCDYENNSKVTVPEQIENRESLRKTVQAVLRNKCWLKLKRHGFYIHFGYDYYLYVGTMQSDITVKALAAKYGLYCEPMPSPYKQGDV